MVGRSRRRSRWEERIKGVKRESEVWEIINRERRGRGRINEDIDMEEWKEYFMSVLDGVEGRVIMGGGKEKGEERNGEGEEEEEISMREIK